MIAFLLATALSAPASQPASMPVTAQLRIRVIYGHNKPTTQDTKVSDLFGLLNSFAYKTYELKETTDVKLVVDGPTVSQKLPANRHLNVAASRYRKPKNKVQIDLEIPELKFKTKASVMTGATLVIGGPKFEDGVLFFALTATSLGN